MIVYHIPSWYPSPASPYAGVFIKELIEAIATYNARHTHYIADMYACRYQIVLRQPLSGWSTYISYLKQRKIELIAHELPNMFTMCSPIMDGNEKIFGAVFEQMLTKCKAQIQYLAEKNMKPETIHAHVCYPAGAIAQQLSSLFDIPYMISEQAGEVLMANAYGKYQLGKYITTAYGQASAITCLSNFHKIMLKNYGVDNPIIIPNVVHDDVFVPANGHLPNRHFTFFAMANLKVDKGFEDLLQSMAILLKRGISAHLRIGGHGPDKDYLHTLAQQLHIDNHITWLGSLSRNDAVHEYQHCDCFILPSKSESFGVVYIEALACGKPVIATNCGGPSDIINIHNGILVAVSNIEAIADAMQHMVGHAQQYNSNDIRKYAVEKFGRHAVAQAMMDVYNKL